MEKIANVKDASEVFTKVLDYILGRTKERYGDVEEAKGDVNAKFEEVMQVIQDNYNRWFKNELFSNLGEFGIEILGDEGDVVIEPDMVDEQAGGEMDNGMEGGGIDEGGVEGQNTELANQVEDNVDKDFFSDEEPQQK